MKEQFICNKLDIIYFFINFKTYNVSKNSFTKKELLACASGDLFTKKHSRVPTDPMLMIDRITNISTEGGNFNKGIINRKRYKRRKLVFSFPFYW